VIYGKSEQAQYKGKNLLNYEKWKTVNIANGTAVFENNGVTLTAIDEDAYTYYTDEKSKILVTVGKTYTLSWESEQIEGSRAFIFPNGMIPNSVEVRNEKQVKYTVPVGIDYIMFRVGVLKKGQTISFKNIMFEEGSERTDFEPYTGGKPSPNPDHPQEIKAVVNPVIKTYGKNLLKVTFQDKMQDGVTCTNNGDGTYTLNGTATRQIDFSLFGKYDSTVRIPTDIRKTYIIKKSGNSNIQLHVGVAYKYAVVCATEDGLIENKAGISYFICRILSGATLNNFTIYPQIEEGSVSTDFKPYQETQATLPYELYAIPVSSGGNVTIDGQQYISDYVDIEKGVLVRKTACGNILDLFHIRKVNEGDAKWWDSSVSDMVDMEQNSGHDFYEGTAGLFSKLKSYLFSDFYNKKIAMGIMNSQKYLIINMPKSYGLTTKQKWEDFLRDCKILKQLSNSVEINLTQDQLEAFKALSTYYPKTYINAESEQLNAYTMFNYPVSMEKGWEYVKQQIGDTRKYVYDMDTKLTETEASTLEAKIDAAILSEMIGG
jgi:hypothetical protein